ncbi:MAG: 4Fe-4S binding protein [Firmicutes bacterium]|nr:4Fe-4S binding protein [Bacillota bacterium]HOB21439.1 aldo/keto reductase [Bacillota bacterium]HQD40134.1 aldo/keto reductase [Bacillota bacterium]
MEYTFLGQTGIKVSRLCFGALTIGPLQANLPPSAGAKVIKAALEMGVNFIDTAELYGTYPHIAQAIRGSRDQVVIASKSYAYTREGMAESLANACRELGTDYIDIFMLHEQESELTIRGHWEAVEYLLEAKEKGLVRAVGISTHAVRGVLAAAEFPELDVIHPLYNIRGLGILDGTREEMREAIGRAARSGKGIYAMKPLGGGNFRDNVQEAFTYILQTPGVDAVAVGMQTTHEVELNVRLVSGMPVSEELYQKVSSQSRRLHIDDWCQGCGSCVEKCPQGALELRGGKAVVRQEECLLCGYCAAACPEFVIKVV